MEHRGTDLVGKMVMLQSTRRKTAQGDANVDLGEARGR
jgi:hypothetical protein